MSDQDPEQPTVEQAALEAAAAEQAAYAAAAGEQPPYEPVAEPVYAAPLVEEPAPEPTPVVGPADATPETPAGTAAFPQHAPPAPIGDERPEILVGAAFGGGLVAALLLKGMARRKHR